MLLRGKNVELGHKTVPVTAQHKSHMKYL